jgi:hypothetical protein
MQLRQSKNYKLSPMLQTKPRIEAPNHAPADRLHNQDQDHTHSSMEGMNKTIKKKNIRSSTE